MYLVGLHIYYKMIHGPYNVKWRHEETTVTSRMQLVNKSVDQGIRLLYQPDAQYQIHVNCKGITSIYFGEKYAILRVYGVLVL